MIKIKDDHYIFNKNIMEKEVDSNLLLLNTDNGEMITLNDTAKSIYYRLKEYQSLDDTKVKLLKEYDVEESVLEDELQNTIDRFIEMYILINMI